MEREKEKNRINLQAITSKWIAAEKKRIKDEIIEKKRIEESIFAAEKLRIIDEARNEYKRIEEIRIENELVAAEEAETKNLTIDNQSRIKLIVKNKRNKSKKIEDG
jgi:hypothetical protein